MAKRLLAIFTLAMPAISLLAGQINLPSRYVVTSYNVHLLTGATSDERTKDSIIPSPLEATKVTVDGAEKLRFTAKSKGGNDYSSNSETEIAYSNKVTLVQFLKQLPNYDRQQNLKPVDSVETLFEEEDLKLELVRTKKSKKVYFDFTIGDRVYVLNDVNDIRKLVKLLTEI